MRRELFTVVVALVEGGPGLPCVEATLVDGEDVGVGRARFLTTEDADLLVVAEVAIARGLAEVRAARDARLAAERQRRRIVVVDEPSPAPRGAN